MKMSPYCQWSLIDGTWVCSECGARVDSSMVAERPFAACRKGSERLGIEFRNIVQAHRSDRHRNMNGGVGSEIKRLLAKIGITPTANCKCNSRAAQCDAWGPDICEAKIDTIVGWLREEAEARNMVFVEFAARMLVKRAISVVRAKEEQTITDARNDEHRGREAKAS